MMFSRFQRSESGSVSVEMALICTVMIMLTLGAVEAGYAYTQHSAAQNAARHGARLAALSAPVSNTVDDASGSYDITCAGGTRSCSSGRYRSDAMDRIVRGPDSDGQCAATTRERRGMCDVMNSLSVDDVSVRYVGALPAAGQRQAPPLVTVTIAERPLKTVLLGGALPGRFRTLPSVSASLMGEDLDG